MVEKAQNREKGKSGSEAAELCRVAYATIKHYC